MRVEDAHMIGIHKNICAHNTFDKKLMTTKYKEFLKLSKKNLHTEKWAEILRRDF